MKCIRSELNLFCLIELQAGLKISNPRPVCNLFPLDLRLGLGSGPDDDGGLELAVVAMEALLWRWRRWRTSARSWGSGGELDLVEDLTRRSRDRRVSETTSGFVVEGRLGWSR